MKTLILSAILFASLTTSAQFYVKAGVGMSQKQKMATANFDLGYDAKAVFIQAGMIPHLSNAVKGGTLFNAQAGHTFNIGEAFSLMPSVGYGYAMRSSEKTQLNQSGSIISLYLVKNTFAEPLQLYAGASYFDKSIIFSAGLKLNVINY